MSGFIQPFVNIHKIRIITDKIRIITYKSEQLICAADLAEYIDDAHYRRNIQDYDSSYKKLIMFKNKNGKHRLTLFLTQLGFYKYILGIQIPGAMSIKLKIQKYLQLMLDPRLLISENNIEIRVKLGFVYFIREEKMVKIGYTTKSPSHRLMQLQTGNPHKLRIVTVFSCADAPAEELVAHKYFEAKRGQGEWFNITDDEVHEYVISYEQKLADEQDVSK